MEIPFQSAMPGGPIPRFFYDYVTDAPIDKCLMCGCELLHADTFYVIEKAVKGTDVLYEFAICLPCSEKGKGRMSEASADSIRDFMSNKVNMRGRMARLWEQYGGFDAEGWVEECIVSGRKRSEISEYTLYGIFRNDQIVVGELPFMISMEAQLQISELLSQETKDEMGRLGDENLGVPPEFEELFRKRTPVLL